MSTQNTHIYSKNENDGGDETKIRDQIQKIAQEKLKTYSTMYDFDEKGTALPKYEKHIPQGRKLFRTDKAREVPHATNLNWFSHTKNKRDLYMGSYEPVSVQPSTSAGIRDLNQARVRRQRSPESISNQINEDCGLPAIPKHAVPKLIQNTSLNKENNQIGKRAIAETKKSEPLTEVTK
jgi:hypothetical protein